MGAQNQRPRFYEGQYLSAEDLAAVVDYLRARDGRHALAAHTWGIALGLTLTEESAPGADHRVEVTLQPGFASDGYAREIVNSRPTRLREELFADIPYHPDLDDLDNGGTGRLVPVWLAYDEAASKNPPPGFETCAPGDQHARVSESFRFEVGKKAATEQRGRVAVGTTSLDPADALSRFDPTEGTLWDASVPHQQFPAGKPPRWLIPIGYIRWIARDQELGYFAERALAPADNVEDRIRSFRRYIGAVAEYIHAADGAIVLHRRDDRPELAHRFANLMRQGNTAALLQDLVWVEGNLRVVGDARLAGGQLHFGNADGEDEQTPLYLSRTGDNPASGDPGLRNLRIILGPTAQDDNRLVVGPEDATKTPSEVSPHLVVVSSGRVGVGTAAPATSLEVVGNWNNGEGAIRVTGDQPAIRLEGGTPTGDTSWVAHVADDPEGNLRFAFEDDSGAWQGVLHATTDGRAGVGTPEPTHPLGVRASGDEELLISFEDPNGVGTFEINHKPEGNSGLNFAQTGVTASTLFLADGGNVGIGTMEPESRLEVVSPNALQGTLRVFSGSADIDYDGGTDALFVFRDTSNGVTTFDQTKLGVGTRAPRGRLAVRAQAANSDVLSFETSGGATRWHVNQATTGVAGLNVVETAGGSSRLFLKDGGNAGIGTSDPQSALHVAGRRIRVNGLGDEQAYIGGDGVANDIEVGSAKAGVEWVTLWNSVDGKRMNLGCHNIESHNIFYDILSALSDANLKTDVRSIERALDTVARLRGVQFRWKADANRKGAPELGVIAQEVAKVLPQLVTETPRGSAVSYVGMIPVLIEAIKELKDEVDTLREEVRRSKGDARDRTRTPSKPRAPRKGSAKAAP